jgi:hypothetical protein
MAENSRSSQRPLIKFEGFFDKEFLISTGFANIFLSLETLGAIGFSVVLTQWAWGIWAFDLYIPRTNFDLGIAVPYFIWIVPFILFKFATAKRSFVDQVEDLKSLFVPKIKVGRDVDLVSPYTDDLDD